MKVLLINGSTHALGCTFTALSVGPMAVHGCICINLLNRKKPEPTNEARAYRLRFTYWLGDSPKCFLNIRVKCWGYSKPSCSAVEVMLVPLMSNFWA